MMKILTAAQMKSVDRRAIELGIPSLLLMESAAIAVADAILETFPEAARVTLFCGPGNNGGDGLALARLLDARGLDVEVFLAWFGRKPSTEAEANRKICEKAGVSITTLDDEKGIESAVRVAEAGDLVVDALFGTGLSRPLEAPFSDLVLALGSVDAPVVAVDLPSGLDASTHRVSGAVIEAELTVTFVAPKIAHVFSPASDYCGEVVVAAISIPESALEQENVAISMITPEAAAALFPRRQRQTHKGTYGHVAIVAGSPGRSGAALLAARGSIRSGCGLVTVLSDASTAAAVVARSPEAMTAIIDAGEGARKVADVVNRRDAALLGPGLPDDDSSWQFARELTAAVQIPAVVDASALNAFEGRIADLSSSHPRVLTPHPGELARLLGRDTSAIVDDRLESAQTAARSSGCVVVLKGDTTLIAVPDGEVFVNPTGNPGMATGGMGDVLGGIIASLLAQGHEAIDAAIGGVYLHGLAGDMLEEESSDTGLAAFDLAEALPRAIARLRESG
ncbi:MAG TPA: NAD(P)H-hydrate dehydratase [Thermoanaerobaculia bacterium]|nr:NAD(P)H-hydrate dehydratase [Thermoanaerobaculia bacterium]